MNRKPFGKTIRQELIDAAALKLRIWRRNGQAVKACDAIESVCDGSRAGTLGDMMSKYVFGLGMTAARRLEAAIENEAK